MAKGFTLRALLKDESVMQDFIRMREKEFAIKYEYSKDHIYDYKKIFNISQNKIKDGEWDSVILKELPEMSNVDFAVKHNLRVKDVELARYRLNILPFRFEWSGGVIEDLKKLPRATFKTKYRINLKDIHNKRVDLGLARARFSNLKWTPKMIEDLKHFSHNRFQSIYKISVKNTRRKFKELGFEKLKHPTKIDGKLPNNIELKELLAKHSVEELQSVLQVPSKRIYAARARVRGLFQTPLNQNQNTASEDVLNLSVKDLDVTDTLKNDLLINEVYTIGELVSHQHKDLLNMINIGRKKISELEFALEKFNLVIHRTK